MLTPPLRHCPKAMINFMFGCIANIMNLLTGNSPYIFIHLGPFRTINVSKIISEDHLDLFSDYLEHIAAPGIAGYDKKCSYWSWLPHCLVFVTTREQNVYSLRSLNNLSSSLIEPPQTDVEDDSQDGDEEDGEEDQVEAGLVELPAGLGLLHALPLETPHQTYSGLQLTLEKEELDS